MRHITGRTVIYMIVLKNHCFFSSYFIYATKGFSIINWSNNILEYPIRISLCKEYNVASILSIHVII